jgi:hypothetical protein
MKSAYSELRRAPGRFAALLAFLGCLAGTAFAEDEKPRPEQTEWGRLTMIEENDSIFLDDDRYYTQGAQFTWLSPSVGPGSLFYGPFDLFSGGPFAPFQSGGQWHRQHYEILLGQQVFTPSDISLSNPPAEDRPYAGWLYGGIGMTQDIDHRQLDHLELGATVGNVMTYGETGLTLRFGQGLLADYGQQRMRPSTSGTSYFNADSMTSPFGYYVFVAAQGRAVGRNIFLDGNTFEDSRSVDKKPLVGDLSAGISMFWSDNFRIDGSATYRTREFDEQTGDRVIFGGFNISFNL